MEQSKFENIKIDVLGLEHHTGEYENIGNGTIHALFINHTSLMQRGLFYFKNFGFENVENEIEIFKEAYANAESRNFEFYKTEFEKIKNIKINSLDDTLLYGVSDNGETFHMNVSSVNSEADAIEQLNNLIGYIYGNYPSHTGIQNEIIIKAIK